MKRILIIAAIASGLFWSGCQKDLDTYQGESGIYFDHQEKETQNNLRADTLSFGWGQIDGDILETKISLRINLIGDVADYDRKFQVLVTETIIPEELKGKMEAAVEGVDYRAFETECMIPAHEVSTNLDITLLRTEALQTESRALTIALQETEELKFLYSREITDKENNRRRIDLQRVIVMNENLAKPDWWDNWMAWGYFGNYYPEVYRKWIEIYYLGADPNYYNGEPLYWNNMPPSPSASWYPVLDMYYKQLKLYFEENDVYPDEV